MSRARDIGCSQEDHIPNCAHFGYSGGYLSDHLKTCPCFRSNKAECNCNPTARKNKMANGLFVKVISAFVLTT